MNQRQIFVKNIFHLIFKFFTLLLISGFWSKILNSKGALQLIQARQDQMAFNFWTTCPTDLYFFWKWQINQIPIPVLPVLLMTTLLRILYLSIMLKMVFFYFSAETSAEFAKTETGHTHHSSHYHTVRSSYNGNLSLHNSLGNLTGKFDLIGVFIYFCPTLCDSQ